MKSIYDEFDLKCRQMDLSEVFTTKSQDTYFLMRRIFEEKNIRFLGYGDDYNGEYKIRFSNH